MEAARHPTINLVKLLFAFAVVFVHAGGGDAGVDSWFLIWSPLRVPLFFIIALYYFIPRAELPIKAGEQNWSSLRIDRLLVPYLVWSGIHLLLRGFRHIYHGSSFSQEWLELFAYGGAAIHLYFLPFLMLCQMALVSLLFMKHRLHWWRAVGLMVIVAAVSCVGSAKSYAQFEDSLPRILLYASLAMLLKFSQRTNLGRMINAWVGMLLCVAVIVASGLNMMPEWLLWHGAPVFGYAICGVVLNLPAINVSSKALLHAMTCSYGIYLSHFMVIRLYDYFAGWAGIAQESYSLKEKLVFSLMVCIICMGLISLIRRSRPLRYLLLGESYSKRSVKKTSLEQSPADERQGTQTGRMVPAI